MSFDRRKNVICMRYKKMYDDLVAKMEKYHPSKDFAMVWQAYVLASEAHGEQLRRSGEPYIIHPLEVALILADLELDIETIVAGILHDVLEDTSYSAEQITEMFGAEVVLLVDGVTKLDKIEYTSKEELQAENYRKMFLAMAKDIRVILIKIADRLHNMRTLKYMTDAKQKEIAQETLDIYAPLAHRLGISTIRKELEDLSLKYLNPEAYYDLADKIQRKQSDREEYIVKIVQEIKLKLEENDIEASIEGRPKHFFSIYKKMKNDNKTLDQIYDLFAVRVLVNTTIDCYEVLGIVHEIYKPVPGRFKDYIAMPKTNKYQSLHNTLIGPEGEPFEVQIRTFDMHRTAEYGIAAHWRYKEGKTGEMDNSEEAKLTWLREILEWQKDMSDNKEFMATIRLDLDVFGENVYCFTPKGSVINLPTGATPIDFAYSIHSAVGNKMVGARVNGRIVSFDYKIENGDRIEIITSQNSRGPSMDWLRFAKSSKAKNKISQWYKKVNKEENVVHGKELLEREVKKKNLSMSDLLTPLRMKQALNRYAFKDWDSLCAAVGHGGLKEGQIINKLYEEYKRETEKTKIIAVDDGWIQDTHHNLRIKQNVKGEVTIQGLDDLDIRLSRCCNPVPGDEIVGFITRGRGVSVHRTDCVNIINLDGEERHRILGEVEWRTEGTSKTSYLAEIKIICSDRRSLLVDISGAIDAEGISVRNVTGRTTKEQAIFQITLDILDVAQLEKLCNKIRSIPDVYDIERVTT